MRIFPREHARFHLPEHGHVRNPQAAAVRRQDNVVRRGRLGDLMYRHGWKLIAVKFEPGTSAVDTCPSGEFRTEIK